MLMISTSNDIQLYWGRPEWARLAQQPDEQDGPYEQRLAKAFSFSKEGAENLPVVQGNQKRAQAASPAEPCTGDLSLPLDSKHSGAVQRGPLS